MTYVAVYDIADDDQRDNVATILEGFGYRVQKSVFECDLEPERLADLCARLSRALAEVATGNVRIYRVCRACLADSIGIGTAAPSLPADQRVLTD